MEMVGFGISFFARCCHTRMSNLKLQTSNTRSSVSLTLKMINRVLPFLHNLIQMKSHLQCTHLHHLSSSGTSHTVKTLLCLIILGNHIVLTKEKASKWEMQIWEGTRLKNHNYDFFFFEMFRRCVFHFSSDLMFQSHHFELGIPPTACWEQGWLFDPDLKPVTQTSVPVDQCTSYHWATRFMGIYSPYQSTMRNFQIGQTLAPER